MSPAKNKEEVMKIDLYSFTKYICPHCNEEGYSMKDIWIEDMKSMEQGDASCEFCGKRFAWCFVLDTMKLK